MEISGTGNNYKTTAEKQQQQERIQERLEAIFSSTKMPEKHKCDNIKNKDNAEKNHKSEIEELLLDKTNISDKHASKDTVTLISYKKSNFTLLGSKAGYYITLRVKHYNQNSGIVVTEKLRYQCLTREELSESSIKKLIQKVTLVVPNVMIGCFEDKVFNKETFEKQRLKEQRKIKNQSIFVDAVRFGVKSHSIKLSEIKPITTPETQAGEIITTPEVPPIETITTTKNPNLEIERPMETQVSKATITFNKPYITEQNRNSKRILVRKTNSTEEPQATPKVQEEKISIVSESTTITEVLEAKTITTQGVKEEKTTTPIETQVALIPTEEIKSTKSTLANDLDSGLGSDLSLYSESLENYENEDKKNQKNPQKTVHKTKTQRNENSPLVNRNKKSESTDNQHNNVQKKLFPEAGESLESAEYSDDVSKGGVSREGDASESSHKLAQSDESKELGAKEQSEKSKEYSADVSEEDLPREGDASDELESQIRTKQSLKEYLKNLKYQINDLSSIEQLDQLKIEYDKASKQFEELMDSIKNEDYTDEVEKYFFLFYKKLYWVYDKLAKEEYSKEIRVILYEIEILEKLSYSDRKAKYNDLVVNYNALCDEQEKNNLELCDEDRNILNRCFNILKHIKTNLNKIEYLKCIKVPMHNQDLYTINEEKNQTVKPLKSILKKEKGTSTGKSVKINDKVKVQLVTSFDEFKEVIDSHKERIENYNRKLVNLNSRGGKKKGTIDEVEKGLTKLDMEIDSLKSFAQLEGNKKLLELKKRTSSATFNESYIAREGDVSEESYAFGEGDVSGEIDVSEESYAFGEGDVSGEIDVSEESYAFGEGDVSGEGGEFREKAEIKQIQRLIKSESYLKNTPEKIKKKQQEKLNLIEDQVQTKLLFWDESPKTTPKRKISEFNLDSGNLDSGYITTRKRDKKSVSDLSQELEADKKTQKSQQISLTADKSFTIEGELFSLICLFNNYKALIKALDQRMNHLLSLEKLSTETQKQEKKDIETLKAELTSRFNCFVEFVRDGITQDNFSLFHKALINLDRLCKVDLKKDIIKVKKIKDNQIAFLGKISINYKQENSKKFEKSLEILSRNQNLSEFDYKKIRNNLISQINTIKAT